MNEQTRQELIMNTLNQLVQPDEVRELRILGTNQGTQSGYFDDLEKLASAAASFDGRYNVFFTINPVKPELLARANNHLMTRAKQTTSDDGIEKIAYLPIDLDPERASGISSNDKEHDFALKKARQIRQHLKKLGWPDPLLADSGNGAHLLYYVDLENTFDNRTLIQRILKSLDFKFSSKQVHVDTATYNPARIWKLYGTLACKGDATSDRPHRRSKVIESPEKWETVSLALLENLASEMPEIPEATTKKAKGSPFGLADKLDLPAKLKEYGIEIVLQAPWQNGIKYIPKICPWNSEHTNRSAYVIQFDSGAIVARCHHNSCSEQSWKTLRKKYEPEWQAGTDAKDSDKDDKETQAEVLIRLGSGSTYLHDNQDQAYAVVNVDNHPEITKVKSRKFKLWLQKLYYDETKKAPAADAMNQALGVLESRAIFDGEECTLHKRVAEQNGIFYYDLSDKSCRVVQITSKGCVILEEPPTLFLKTKNLKPQLEPCFTGDLTLIKKHFRFKNNDDVLLFMVYLVACLVPDIPHPILVLAGEKGAAKSTSMRMTRAIVDPAVQDLMSMPNSKEDFVLSLANNYMPSFDNLDSLSAEKSDLLCMACTGGALSKRTLYTDDEETMLTFKRCVTLNGINVVATRPDLLDRSIILELERIGEKDRKEEAEIWERFNLDLPQIIGATLTALSKAMKIYPTVQLDKLPRMADFTKWGFAIAEALGIGGDTFVAAYMSNLSKANAEAVAAHPVAAAILALMKDSSDWSGSVATLLSALERIAFTEKINITNKAWPQAAHILSRKLNEVKSNLEDLGIDFDIRHFSQSKIVTIKNKNVKKAQDLVVVGRPPKKTPLSAKAIKQNPRRLSTEEAALAAYFCVASAASAATEGRKSVRMKVPTKARSKKRRRQVCESYLCCRIPFLRM